MSNPAEARQSAELYPPDQQEDLIPRSVLYGTMDTNMQNPSTVAGVIRSRECQLPQSEKSYSRNEDI